MFKGIRHLAVVIFVCYFVSIVGGPAYGWNGENNGIAYQVDMHQWRGDSVTIMEKERSYIFNIIASNLGCPIKELSVGLPDGFILDAVMTKEVNIPNKNWNHVFDIRASDIAGNYNFRFFGKDECGNNIDFLVGVKVANKESSEYFSDELKDITAKIGFFVFIFAALKISGVIR